MLHLALTLAVALQATPGQALPDPAADAAADAPVQVPDDRARLDAGAEQTLQALLARMQGLEGVRVDVEAGLARLTGEVPSAEARDRAEEVARRVEGVAFVDNRLDLSRSLSEQLDPALQRLRDRLTDLLALLPSLVVALLAVGLAFLVAGWIGRLEAPYAALTDNAFVENVLRQLARALTVLLGVLVAVEILDITTLVGAVVGTAGVAGIALGFAFKDIVENYLAGLLLSVRQPFAPNDTVEIQDVVGKVVRLTSRETILLDLDGNHVRIPNATVFRTVVRNFTRNPKRRFEVRLTVGPGEDLSRAMGLGRQVLHAMRGVLDEPEPTSRVDEVGDSWVVLVWNGWVDQSLADFGKVRSEAIRLVLGRLAEEGVDMPPPEQRVRVLSEEPSPERKPEPAEAGETAAGQRDVSVDRTLDDQIEEDRRRSGEEDLLR